jgi:cytochrome oxidase Cu insertion factor (SCO1/SenC/PrrC family)
VKPRTVTLSAVAVLALALAVAVAVDLLSDEPGATAVSGAPIEQLLADLQVLPLHAAPAPPFTLETTDGRRVALADHAGRPVLLYFWASW